MASKPPAYGPQQQPATAPGNPVYYQQPGTVVVQPRPPVQSFVLHIVLSCFVFWCCGCCCGLIAFILALVGQGKADSEPDSARSLGKASIAFSIIGIVIGIILIIVLIVLYVVVGVSVVKTHSDALSVLSDDCKYRVGGLCYADRRSGSFSDCTFGELYHSGYCYFD